MRTSALGRVGILLRARLSSGPRGALPIAPLLAQALIASFLCAVVRDVLPPFAYGVFALTLTAALVAIPLLGELGWLLRRDPAREWVAALPARAVERRLARTLHLLVLLWALALGSLVPAAVFAPETAGTVARLALPLCGLGLVTFLAALLLGVQSLLGERAEGLLVAVQTLLVVAVVVGVVTGVREIPALARLPNLGDAHAPYLWGFPPCWFAAPLAAVEGEPARWWLPAIAGLTSLALLIAIPAPATPRRGRRASWITLLLAPVRRLASLAWVRRDERGAFDLVYDALPREREVVLRTVPMLGIPLAFLAVAASDAELGGKRDGVLALLLLTAGTYLPILLSHVPATATPRAVWLLRCSPIPEGAVVSGTIKALTAHFLVPLYALLALAAWSQAGSEIVTLLALPGFLISVLVLRLLYPVCVSGPPLSTAPDEIRFDLDWIGVLGGIALVLTLLTVLAQRYVTTALPALAAVGVLVAIEVVLDRRLRRRLG